MTRRSRYSPEVKERAVRMVFDQQAQHESQWSAISSIASKIDCTRETLRTWVRRAERDAGKRAGLTTDERQRLKELERENRELKRANEILRKASAFFGSSLNFPVKSPYGSPRSVKLLIPPTCLAGEARCEAPRLS